MFFFLNYLNFFAKAAITLNTSTKDRPGRQVVVACTAAEGCDGGGGGEGVQIQPPDLLV